MAERSDQVKILIGPDMNREKKDLARSISFFKIFICFLFKIQILLFKKQVLSFFLDRYCLSYGPIIKKSQKRPFQKLYKNLVFVKISRRTQF